VHSHLGSIGNLGNKEIREKLRKVLSEFGFDLYQEKLNLLIEG